MNNQKFEKLSVTADEHLSTVREKVNNVSKQLKQNEKISKYDKTMITGLTDNNRVKQAPEYRAVSPYTYPSFKIHKLTKEEITEKKIPPARLIHASKYGPLYRAEKWTSPHLTKRSRSYCEDEFVRDTNHLLSMIEEENNSGTFINEGYNLFTLDVEKLYPSIQPNLAMEAINDLLDNSTEEDSHTADAVKEYIKLSFDESYVTFKDEVYKPKVGIPTGGSLSRQIADVFLHWLLFKKIDTSIMNRTELKFWKRFIDDGFGIWRGNKRTFIAFVKKLNSETNKYGINFPINEMQFGKSVNYLDITLYIDTNNKIQYRSYSKPTDAKRYLQPSSYHPRNVFNSVPYSQMIRTIEHNSTEEDRKRETEELMINLEKSGYKKESLEKIEEKVKNRQNNEETNDDNTDTLTFPIHYFDQLDSFKEVLKDASEDLSTLIGDTKIIMAVKKNPSIGNVSIRNKQLSMETKTFTNQKCNGPGCKQCPLVNTDQQITINNRRVNTPAPNLNCKSKNVIYLWQCKLCTRDNSYFGRTVQPSHKRTNTHRGCFMKEEEWEESALSMHAKSCHGNNFSLNNFKISLVRQCTPQTIRREEFKYIDKYKTRVRGINRYKN